MNYRIKKLIEIVKKNYNVYIKVIFKLNKANKFNTYIDTTGDSIVLKKVFDCAYFNSTIIILSTPRDEKYLISPLLINRKNLFVIGGHELNGTDNEDRQNTFEKILEINKEKNFLKKFINEYDFSEEKLKEIKKQKSNFIEIFKY